MPGPRHCGSTETRPGSSPREIRSPDEGTIRRPLRHWAPQANATVHRWRPTVPFAATRCITPGIALLALLASLAPPALAADGPGADAAPIRFDAGTARHRNALAGTAAEGIAEGEFVIAKVDFDGDGTDETVVQGRAQCELHAPRGYTGCARPGRCGWWRAATADRSSGAERVMTGARRWHAAPTRG